MSDQQETKEIHPVAAAMEARALCEFLRQRNLLLADRIVALERTIEEQKQIIARMEHIHAAAGAIRQDEALRQAQDNAPRQDKAPRQAKEKS